MMSSCCGRLQIKQVCKMPGGKSAASRASMLGSNQQSKNRVKKLPCTERPPRRRRRLHQGLRRLRLRQFPQRLKNKRVQQRQIRGRLLYCTRKQKRRKSKQKERGMPKEPYKPKLLESPSHPRCRSAPCLISAQRANQKLFQQNPKNRHPFPKWSRRDHSRCKKHRQKQLSKQNWKAIPRQGRAYHQKRPRARSISRNCSFNIIPYLCLWKLMIWKRLLLSDSGCSKRLERSLTSNLSRMQQRQSRRSLRRKSLMGRRARRWLPLVLEAG
mmetsp:Transcript_48777/g.113900  ORF Transcript_48777/g.113900 Transcript_48777/m.113900 type:complete len:270 (-) Transcript_48777:77-886(-)